MRDGRPIGDHAFTEVGLQDVTCAGATGRRARLVGTVAGCPSQVSDHVFVAKGWFSPHEESRLPTITAVTVGS